MTLYPVGYGSSRVTMRRLRELHEPRMHPEFARRLFAWIESKNGTVGIGGGWRLTQPTKPGFAPAGKSFHQDQRFASQLVAFAAVDLVKANPAGGNHITIPWSYSDDAGPYGLHTFIDGEPWHMQCTSMRGWLSWVNAGRPDPFRQALPGPIAPPIPQPEVRPPVTTTTTVWQNRRILDSRWWDDAGRFGSARPGDNGVRNIPCPEAAGAGAVTVTVTSTASAIAGFVTLFTSGTTPPANDSCLALNPTIGAANTTTVAVAADGSFQVYVNGDSHLIIDLVGVHS